VSTGANVTLALAVATGGAVLAWAGFADPPGGLAGAIQRTMAGQAAAPAKAVGDPLSFVQALYPGPGAGSTATAATTTGGAAGSLVAEARKHLGKPYLWGGAGPDRFDCSGLVFYCYKRLGKSVPRTAGAQYSASHKITEAEAVAGDLVFFGAPIYHVGIVLGPGRMLAAPKAGDVVKEQSYEWGRTAGRGPLRFGRIPLAAKASTPGLIYT
jgi:cell wall-associated NlpC family hydrolase